MACSIAVIAIVWRCSTTREEPTIIGQDSAYARECAARTDTVEPIECRPTIQSTRLTRQLQAWTHDSEKFYLLRGRRHCCLGSERQGQTD